MRITASQHLLVVLDEADLYTDEDDETQLDMRPALVRYNGKSETAARILDLAEGTIVIFTNGPPRPSCSVSRACPGRHSPPAVGALR